jgi:hypothetical protein
MVRDVIVYVTAVVEDQMVVNVPIRRSLLTHIQIPPFRLSGALEFQWSFPEFSPTGASWSRKAKMPQNRELPEQSLPGCSPL